MSKGCFQGPGTGLYGVSKGCFQGVLGRGFMVCPRGVFRESWDGALWCTQGVFSGSPGTGLYGVPKGCFQAVLGRGFAVLGRGFMGTQGVFSGSPGTGLYGVPKVVFSGSPGTGLYGVWPTGLYGEGVFTRRWSVLRWDLTVWGVGGGSEGCLQQGGLYNILRRCSIHFKVDTT